MNWGNGVATNKLIPSVKLMLIVGEGKNKERGENKNSEKSFIHVSSVV